MELAFNICQGSTPQAFVKTAPHRSLQVASAARSEDVSFFPNLFLLFLGIRTLTATGISQTNRKTISAYSERVPLDETALGQHPDHGRFAGVPQLPHRREAVGNVIA